jgi:hypothetical protein
MYWVYLWQNNTFQKVWKLHIYFKTKVVNEIFGWFFFMVYDIDIHGLNLWPFKDLKFCDEISLLKKNAFFNNECIVIIFLKKTKTIAISKRRRFYRWALHVFFNFLLFGNVSWTTNMRLYGRWKTVSYILYVHWFYPIFFIYRWIKINFDSKCTLSSKMFSCKFLSFLLVFMIAKNCHQHFNFLHIIIFDIHHLF